MIIRIELILMAYETNVLPINYITLLIILFLFFEKNKIINKIKKYNTNKSAVKYIFNLKKIIFRK